MTEDKTEVGENIKEETCVEVLRCLPSSHRGAQEGAESRQHG
jgi:hypothetical protein